MNAIAFWESVPVLSKKEYEALYMIIGSQYAINQQVINLRGRNQTACSIRQTILLGESKDDFKFDLKGKVFYFIIDPDKP